METTFFQEILQTNRDINLAYRKSKLPVFIKNILTNKQRKKLKNIIKKIEDTNYLPTELLKEYTKYVYNIMDQGTYKHCHQIIPYDPNEPNKRYIITFYVPVDGDNFSTIIASFTDINETGVNYLCNYSVINGGNNFRFSEENVSILRKEEVTPHPWKSDELNKNIKSIVCDTIIKDIVSSLMDEVERSERINL